ncbi:GNAT family N-acetyltransferase [Enterococcus devriesei]|uniref:GNAT family N-acetyltransferase n=1 Tax=Enterococcus devriesei TaxID=319970 RepID=UPI0028903250|nr:GNAT family N-acetyltransferase [Enterococcus devriesei]MDT2822165.1 GNAT family N-acetyltransferase [Enterococcus devriesei]
MTAIRQIKQLNKNELAVMLNIWERSVTATHHFLAKKEIEALKPEVLNALQTIDQLYGYYDDDILGFMGVEGENIELLFVDAKVRGQGVGKKLLLYGIKQLKIKYVDVNEENQQGFGFYQHLGFEIMGRSEFDEQGKPFPILQLKREAHGEN